jgi:hypothetical protein
VRALRAAVVVAILALPAIPSAGSATLPTVRMTHPGTVAEALIWPGEGLSLSSGAWIEAVGGAFELHAYSSGTVIQVTRNAEGKPREVRRFQQAHNDFAGLSSFFLLDLRDDDGTRVARIRLPFCPESQEASRIDDSGPDLPTMPAGCQGTAVTQATVWGIDAGWAVPGAQTYGVEIDLAAGTYDATLSITSRWVRELAITGPTSVTFPLAVERIDFGNETIETIGAAAKAAEPKDDTGGGVPDLASLPAWDIQPVIDEATGADLLTFAATVWNAGTGPLVVEGFRASGASEMKAYQYFYEDGRPVRRVDAGSFEFHAAGGHDHWHFLDFAQYSLLDRTTGDRVRSQKEAFCLTWTDPVDLTDPDAVWNPGETSLQTACGSPSSIWIRETLPVGWGDTYTQYVAGQSFDITSLPNGRYAIEVGANPNGRLIDLKSANDVALREIELGGTAGARTVRTLTTFP